MSRLGKMVKSLKVILLSLCTSSLLSGVSHALSLVPQQFSPPTDTQGVFSVVTGPDGNLWFTMPNEDKVGKSTPEGVITEYSTSAGSNPAVITSGPDGNLWFTMSNQRFGKITTNGAVTEYNVGINISVRALMGITSGPDGNLWFTASYLNELDGGKILKVSTSGNIIADYDLSLNSPGGGGIVTGPDGNLWFAMGSSANSTNYIGKIDTNGNATEYALPGQGDGGVTIAVGPDGNLWYLRTTGAPEGRIGKIDTNGNATEYALPSGAFAYYGLTSGPDGNLWFTETGLNRVASISTSGEITEYDLPDGFGPLDIVTGPDGNLWLSTVNGLAKISDDTEIPVNPENPQTNSPSIQAPRTGGVVGAAIISASMIALVLLMANEIKKRHITNDRSKR